MLFNILVHEEYQITSIVKIIKKNYKETMKTQYINLIQLQ